MKTLHLPRSLLLTLSALLVGGGLSPTHAQEVVPVGKGSYASFPPPGIANGKAEQMNSRPLFLVNPDDRPIPTNKWWTQLIVSRFAKELWAYPLRVDPSEKGLAIYYPQTWKSEGNGPVCDLPLTVTGKDFLPVDSRAKDWSDWLVSFRLGASPESYFDVTIGEGMPYVWLESRGVQPVLQPPAGAEVAFFDRAGRPATLPATGDCLGITYGGRNYGVFAPDGTRFELDNGAVNVVFSGKDSYLVICPLPTTKDLGYFYTYAYAIPRDTRVSWTYDPAKAQVTTTWKITTQPLKGTGNQVVQGWLPHHYRGTTQALAFNQLEYLTPRGKLRCSVGNEFSITYPYTGVVPNLPAPKKIGGAHDYDPARMQGYLAEVAAKPKFGADTYWGGKDILRFGQGALMAQQTSDASFAAFRDGLRSGMTDWFTYTPGEKDHFFASYPNWKALIGMSPSYGSEGFNDQHFHYGYFTFATALLGMHDRQFLRDYGEMATLVAKQYANWDRTDARFPFLRTFDIWAGHSWAGGTSSGGGNNQESSSEAVQGWAGLIYLGQALDNKDMTAAGIMGYAMETRATMEYWFNEGGDVFPPQWKHPVTGMVWSGGNVYGTYFTGDPAWIYGIQWLPASPMLSYLVRDPAFARKSYENMVKDYDANEQRDAAKKPMPGKKPHEPRPATIKTFGDGLGSVMLGYVLMYDPAWAAEQLDTLWAEPGDKIAHNASQMSIMYYMAHSMRSLGRVDWTCYTTSPTSTVYINEATKTRTYVVWNPLPTQQPVTVYENGKPIGRLMAAPQALTSTTKLSPVAR
jgi:endoglucanase Acf2